jgi:hypothetical protein
MPHVDTPMPHYFSHSEMECSANPYHLSPYEVLVAKEEWREAMQQTFPLIPRRH